MSKNNSPEKGKETSNYPDPVFFQQLFIPLVQQWINKNGGLENMLKQNPFLAQSTLRVLEDSKDESLNWLASNFSFSRSDINASFNRIEQACDQEPTDLAGETGTKAEEVE